MVTASATSSLTKRPWRLVRTKTHSLITLTREILPMQIKDVKFYILEGKPSGRHVRGSGPIEKVPPGLSGLFTHSYGIRGKESEHNPELIEYKDDSLKPTYTSMMRLVTDGDLDAYTGIGSGFHRDELEWQAKHIKATTATLLIGVDAFDREYIWQRLWYAKRFSYPRIEDKIDFMLWDFASRHAKLPLYKLLGGYREKIPAYENIVGVTIDDLVAEAVRAKEQGFVGCKDHSYRGVNGNIEMAQELRAAVGDDFLLMHDPVENYTYSDAVKVGRALEKLNYSWMEEPLQDWDLMGLKKLCDTLDLPILALEWSGAVTGGQPYNASGFLAMQAVDIVRQRGKDITAMMKVVHLAESFGVNVHGGDPHVVLATKNDPVFEAASWGTARDLTDAKLTFQGTAVVENGYMYIACGDHPVEEPNWDEIEKKALAVI